MLKDSGILKAFRNRKAKKERLKLRIEKWQEQRLQHYASDILQSPNFISSKRNIQHGSKSVMDHSMDVAKMCIWIAKKFRIDCNHKELVRGALLHDYFLYDWHTKGEGHQLHGFFHPGIALRNASLEYNLSDTEKEIIRKHMWPLTIIPPTCREAWIVTTADKYCSLLETLKIRR